MRRTLTLALVGVLALAACSDGGDATATEAPTTTEAPATTERATTTVFEPAVAGLVIPPAGFSQAQSDAFTGGMVVELGDSGWPEMSREDSVALLREAANPRGRAVRGGRHDRGVAGR